MAGRIVALLVLVFVAHSCFSFVQDVGISVLSFDLVYHTNAGALKLLSLLAGAAFRFSSTLRNSAMF
jgi:hypothetical protein